MKATATPAKPATAQTRNEHPRKFRPVVLLCFFASGMTSLVLEVVWTRILGNVFGNTVFAASTVLTAFMLGLAIGSAVIGRFADRSRRPFALYGWLEVCIGLYALAFPLLVTGTGVVYGWFYRAAAPGFISLTAVRFILSMIILLPPTILMGGTLPVLGRHLGFRHHEPGQEIGYLYGANTIGGVAGCFVSGFILLETLGVRGSLVAAGFIAIGVGAIALALGHRRTPANETAKSRRKSEVRPAHTTPPVSPAHFRLVLVTFALTGFCSLAYEVLWTRILIFLLTTSVYAFATMLTAFLVGIGMGSFISARFIVRRLRRPLLWFGLIEVCVGLAALASVPLLGQLHIIDAHVSRQFALGGVWQFLLTAFADSFVILFVPTLLMGMAFPIVSAACLRGGEPIGWRIGQVYAANTVGCVLGSLAAGFVLLPLLGTHKSILAVVALNLATGIVIIWQTGSRSLPVRLGLALPATAVAVIAFVLTPSDVFYKTINAYHHPSKIVFIEEHPAGTVTVHDLPNGERLISVDGVDVAGKDFMLRTTQKLQGYIPLCLHPNPRRVVQIGFGSGETARVGMEYGVEDYTVVEICPAVFEAGKFFKDINHGSFKDPRIRRIIMDGKNFALLSAEKFDLIMNDSVYPGSSGSSALYTIDHFRNCRARLAEGGLFSCWVPLDLRPSEMRMILKSFQAVFPHTSFWVASNCVNKHGVILGSLAPLRIDFARLKELLGRPSVRADLEAIEIHDVYDLLDCHMNDEAAIRQMVKNDPVNSDDRPLLEFSCALRPPWDIRLRLTLAMLTSFRAPIVQCVLNVEEEDKVEIDRRFRATTHVFRAQVAQLLGLPNVRKGELDRALQIDPGEAHVKSLEAELEREIRDLRGLADSRPSNRAFVLRLAAKLFVGMQFDESAVIYEALLNAEPPPPDTVFVNLAEIRFNSGRATDAENILRKCLETWPNSAETHDRLGGIYLQAGRLDEAKFHIDQALRADPANQLYLQHQAEIGTARKAASSPSRPAPE